ncbi:DUF305 domain-containing protein [Sphingomonas sp. KRR8]|uniref:DUF305 domain-containing protein n=1 Tax=Sphingomonas sp. KRR8 TaxID=2942996 RepID=UPI00202121C7|nr:DUF305 domain-containing protein [Sphingomonas sp. KRR8]URD61127.1 DUF305 domain-containing protein [Sphingomonas sp. KRR8]
MKKIACLALATTAFAVSACSARQDSQAANNEVAGESNMEAPASMSRMSGSFAEGEMKMDQKMMSAVGSDVAQNWLKKMIAHHDGAIDMSRVVLTLNPTADVAKMARDTIGKQGEENDALRKLMREGAPDQRAADLYKPSMMDMHQKMMAASGSNASETYLRKMLEHHRGAVTMSDVALANGVSGPIRSQVEKTRAEQLREIAMVESMLRGGSAKTGSPVAATKAASSSAAAEQDTARPTSAGSDGNSIGPSAGPHSGHDMNNM